MGKNFTTVKRGEEVKVYFTRMRQEQQVVKAPCENDGNGHWYCATCKQHYLNNLEATGHIDDSTGITHKMVWLCHEHGSEAVKDD